MERAGQKVIKLNVGNPGAFGFHAPENIQRAMIDHLAEADPYSHQKGIVAAREAVVADVTARGVRNVGIDDVFMGNGVSELILMCMEALLEPGDEVLLPAPDYPLWTAAVTLTGGRPVYYGCRPGNGFCPDPDEIARLITPRTRALVMINPNNPTGAVYSRALVEALVRIAETHKLVLFSDEIYDRILYDDAEHVPVAPLCEKTLCATFGGLSKVHLACGYRVGWVTFSGRRDHAGTYLQALELLASLRLCSNVPGQWAVPAALGGKQHIADLTAPTGRLGMQRAAVLEAVSRSKYLTLVAPKGALYAFIGVKRDAIPDFRDARFAMELLETRQVLVVPGSSFNVDYTDHFRTTLLPDAPGELLGIRHGDSIERMLGSEAA
ncbi:MAG: aminotransferase class I/II-fold pyridoxal phosphate-dependent enzyme, partial [Deltaproteobacteria bacterium]